MDAEVEGGFGTRFADHFLDILEGLLIDFLDATGVDPSVENQLFKGIFGDFAA